MSLVLSPLLFHSEFSDVLGGTCIVCVRKGLKFIYILIYEYVSETAFILVKGLKQAIRI